jgi:predicted metal-binding protein
MFVEDYSKIVDVSTTAIARGAIDSKIIKADQVIVGDWVYWKCRFGCPSYSKTLTCPPKSPNPQQTRALLRDYEYALLLKYNSTQDYHSLLVDLEREAFLRGFYKAWSLTAGSCRLCETCNISGGCVNPKKARPSMEACGIDVFGTMHNIGFNLKVLTSKEEIYTRICLLLLR